MDTLCQTGTYAYSQRDPQFYTELLINLSLLVELPKNLPSITADKGSEVCWKTADNYLYAVMIGRKVVTVENQTDLQLNLSHQENRTATINDTDTPTYSAGKSASQGKIVRANVPMRLVARQCCVASRTDSVARLPTV